MKILSIYDKKVNSFNVPFVVPNFVTASRELDRVVNSGKGDFADYPDDFALYHIGTFNELTGEILVEYPPVMKHELVEFKKDKV